jgi:2-polyprenyl-6-methoxyphenol hydroxylase-like FAD-dependent oxidoreductase
MKQRRAIIIGGSISGLFAAMMLQRQGWTVDVFERVATELSGRGAGIVAQPELIARLTALGLDTSDLGISVAKRKVLDISGRVTAASECPQVLTAWERVYRLLRDAFPTESYHPGVALERFSQDDRGVAADFTDGSRRSGDILIGADGLRSSVRAQCLPEIVPLYAGYIAWRALISEAALPQSAREELFEGMTFCLPPSEQFLGYPVAGPGDDLRRGHRRYNIVWYRPADVDTELRSLLTDADGVTHAISIPPPLIRGDIITQMRIAAERLLAPQLRTLVRLIDRPILQPIYDLASPQLAFGRVAIIGDAAYVARPHVGAGVAKAADDAAGLAASLESDDVAAALARFEANRLPFGVRIIERARRLGAYLQANKSAAEGASWRRHSIPEAVLAETAVLNFLHN